MSPVGEAWNCPHCGERILRSAVICPACQRRLRFDAGAQTSSAVAAIYPLRVEGTIRHPLTEAPLEYSVLVQIRDAQGEIVTRRVIGVGAIHPGEARTFTLQVEVRPSEDSAHAAAARAQQADRGKQASQPSQPAQSRKVESPPSSQPPIRPK